MIDVSIIITNYNKEKYIGRAIRSCLKQNFENYEIIVVDDCSTDNSKEVLKSFEGEIKPVYLSKNTGVANASNRGIRKALGAFIIRVDADDYINENTLLFMSEILFSNPDIGFVYSDHLRVDENEQTIERIRLNTLDNLYRHGAGIMFRKSNLEAIGLYDKTFKNAEDHDLLIRYLKNFDGYYLKLPLYRYRQLQGSLSKNDRDKWETKANDKNNR